MAAETKKEIGHVLFIDIVGYSKLLIALDAALEMRAALVGLNQELFSGKDYSLRFGVGIHTATVVAGNVGSPQRYNYTVIGDGVNAASRLQTLTRKAEYDADIIISEATLLESAGQFETRRLGEVAVKGKQELVVIHALLSRTAKPTDRVAK